MQENEREKIYVVDDEDNIRELIKTFLSSEGYHVSAFQNGDSLLEHFAAEPSDLVVLDVMMPGMDGFEVCKELRKTSTVPIIFLTARDSDLDVATGYNLGSDDYFTKPFSAMSLLHKVKAIFRRIDFEKQKNSYNTHEEILNYKDILINTKNMSVKINEEELALTPNEFELLVFLLKNNDRAVSRDELLNIIWGFETQVETRATDDTIRRLRKKIQNSSVTIESVWGFGFRLK